MKHWKQKDGSLIAISAMGNSHLLNAIRFLEKQHQATILSTPDPCFGGEMAQYYAERDYDSLIESAVEDLYPIYEDLQAEASKRGITA